MQKYLDENSQNKLHDKKLFNTAYVSFGAVEWADDFSICADVLYIDSKTI